MTDPPGGAGDDIRRPLDESLPSGQHPPGGPDQTPLRPAAPPTAGPTGAGRRFGTAVAARLIRVAIVTRRAPVRASRAAARWSGRPAGRFAVPGLLIAALLGAALSTGAFLVPTGRGADGGPPDGPAGSDTGGPPGSAPPSGPPPTAAPVNTPGSVPAGQRHPSEAMAGWAAQMRTRTSVPVVALGAYGYAELAAAATTPGCRLSWTTLAAIGRVESNHGSSGGATLLADGRALPPIVGLPLDGQGDRARILDTDGGAMDRDPTYDRAVGPMQFIPSTWQLEAVDATGDGIADVHNVYDAALAAANYLCRGGRNLATAEGWWNAVLSYNHVQSYAEAVFAAANEYGRQSRGAG